MTVEDTREVRISPLYMGMRHLSPLGISLGTACGGVDARPRHGWSIEVSRKCGGGGLRGRGGGGLEAQRSEVAEWRCFYSVTLPCRSSSPLVCASSSSWLRNNEVAAHRPLLAGGRGSQGSPRFVAHTLLRVVGHCSCLHGEVEGDNPAIQAQQDKVQVLKDQGRNTKQIITL